MADAISPRRLLYVGHWPVLALPPLTAAVTAALVRRLADKYAFQMTDRRTNERT